MKSYKGTFLVTYLSSTKIKESCQGGWGVGGGVTMGHDHQIKDLSILLLKLQKKMPKIAHFPRHRDLWWLRHRDLWWLQMDWKSNFTPF